MNTQPHRPPERRGRPLLKGRSLPVRNRGEAGFSLVESVMASVIFIVMMIGGGSYFFGSRMMLDRFATKRVALEVARSKMERLLDAPYATLVDSSEVMTPVTLGGIAATRTTLVEAIDDSLDGIGAADPYPVDYRKITVSVQWTEGAEQSVELFTYRGPYE